jgi:glutathione S-transferase
MADSRVAVGWWYFQQATGFAFRNEPWALKLNPKGTVPFIRDGNLVLNESNTIVAYLCNKYGAGSSLYPATPGALAVAWQWMEFGETFIVPRTNPIFCTRHFTDTSPSFTILQSVL